ncbi:fused MFS/spermidine synthase, partial [Candidatus Fermentibacteria bacterium]|nr:fused MFS/spermidine synthase [Candidatus Fermentibacteria bacterium]
QPSRSPEVGTPAQSGAQTPPGFVFAAAGISGFAFFLMELVWYRMLSPILGGSTYTFGLILALALAGIGLGGFLYALRDQRSAPSPMDLAVTFALEALFIALPLALGDRLAVMAGLVAPLGNIGLLGSVAGWTIVASMVLLPAAVVSGFQFPLLIALLGRGEDEIGRHAGFAYAWNTFGAIIGSLAGGFLLVPILSAPGAWRLVVICLALLSVASLVVGRRGRDGSPSWASAIVVACALACLVAPGPTAPWRHGGIGAGRVDLSARDRHMIRDWASAQRRALVWEREGRESSIGVFRTSGLSLMINGKSDGNAIADASTQIMLGLVGATMHHEPRTALVIGLGTGETAGWLADIAGMERVDVVEFEPAVLDMARMCGPANREALNNPRVRLYIGDGREMVLVAKERYDLIVSEPSNPFRAGIASLYTQEFYRAVAQRLGTGGIFTQWVQAYEVDTETILSIYATLGEVFPWVETWQTNPIDMLLVCSLDSLRMDRQAMARRLEEEPLRSGVLMAWGASDVEGLLARRIAGPELGRRSADIGRAFGLTTDDRTLVEYGFARAVGKARAFRLADLRQVGEGAVEEPESPGAVAIRRNRQAMYALQGIPVPLSEIQGEDEHARAQGYSHFLAGEYGPCLAAWRRQDAPATYPLELAMVGEATADEGDDEALALAQRLAPLWPAEAAVIRARLWVRTGESEMALGSLEEAFAHMRLEPLPCSRVMERGLRLAVEIASSRPDLASRCRAGVAVPFSVDALHDARLRALLDVSRVIGPKEAADVIHQYEPHIPWDREFLALRATCYREADDPLAGVAMADWEDYVADAPLAVNEDLFARAAP